MSTWGYKLYEDDTFCEVVDSFNCKVRLGLTAKQAAEVIRNDYAKDIDFHIAQFAVAECLWKVGELTEDDMSLISSLIHEEIDQKYWKSLDAGDEFVSLRTTEINNFFSKLSNLPPDSQLRKIENSDKCINKGDCFWYRIKGKKYGAVVMEIQSNSHKYYLVALSEMISVTPPTLETIISAQLYTLAWFSDVSMLSPKRIHFVGKIKINNYYYNRYGIIVKADSSVHISNYGQPKTWSHEFRSLQFHNILVRDII